MDDVDVGKRQVRQRLQNLPRKLPNQVQANAVEVRSLHHSHDTQITHIQQNLRHPGGSPQARPRSVRAGTGRRTFNSSYKLNDRCSNTKHVCPLCVNCSWKRTMHH